MSRSTEVLGSVLLGAVIASVGGSAGCGDEVLIRGKVPMVTARSVDGRELREAVGGVDRIEAFPLEKGLIMPQLLRELTRADLGADGSFELTLRTEWDWMLMLVDADAEGSQRFVGYVGATVSAEDELIALPTANVGGVELDLGTISGTSDTWSSTETVDPGAFALTASALTDLARVDSAFKNVKNLLVNFDSEIVHGVYPGFRFNAPGEPGVATDPASYVMRDIWGIQTSTNSPRMTMELLCGDSPPSYALTPPGGDSIVFEGYTCTDGPNGLVASAGGGGFLAANYDREAKAFTPHISMEWGELTGEITAGDWTLSADGDVLATFDLAIARPADDGGLPIGVVPSVRVNTTPSDDIASIDLEWYIATAGGYAKVEDLEIFTHIITDVGVDIDVAGDGEQFRVDPRTTTNLAPTRTWNVGADAAPLTVRVFVNSGGIARQFATDFLVPAPG